VNNGDRGRIAVHAGAPVDGCAASPCRLSNFSGFGPCGYAADNLVRLSIPLQFPLATGAKVRSAGSNNGETWPRHGHCWHSERGKVRASHWRIFCHEVRIDSIRPCRRLAARGLVGEPGACRPETVVRRAASQIDQETDRLFLPVAACESSACSNSGRRVRHHGHGARRHTRDAGPGTDWCCPD
jgi:hypothetical protein